MRRKSKTPLRKATNKADRALQDHFRRIYKGMTCEVCGKPYNVMHHFVEKHLSAALRFYHPNLVRLCNSCHARHHLGGDASIHATVMKTRGIAWWNGLAKKRRTDVQLTIPFLEEIQKTYSA